MVEKDDGNSVGRLRKGSTMDPRLGRPPKTLLVDTETTGHCTGLASQSRCVWQAIIR